MKNNVLNAQPIVPAINGVPTYLEPVIEDQTQRSEETFLKCKYFDCKRQMFPTLKSGDNMLLRKVEMITNWGAIHLLQTRCSNIVCRPIQSSSPDHIISTYEDPSFGGHGQSIPSNAIIEIWELVSSYRIHTNTVAPMS